MLRDNVNTMLFWENQINNAATLQELDHVEKTFRNASPVDSRGHRYLEESQITTLQSMFAKRKAEIEQLEPPTPPMGGGMSYADLQAYARKDFTTPQDLARIMTQDGLDQTNVIREALSAPEYAAKLVEFERLLAEAQGITNAPQDKVGIITPEGEKPSQPSTDELSESPLLADNSPTIGNLLRQQDGPLCLEPGLISVEPRFMTEAGEAFKADMMHNLFSGEECYDYVIGAVPTDSTGKEMIDIIFASPLTAVASASRRLVVRQSLGEKVYLAHSMGEGKAKEMITEILGLVAKKEARIKQGRVHCSVSSAILVKIDKNTPLLDLINQTTGGKYISVRQFLSEYTMLDVIGDTMPGEVKGIVLAMPYGRATLHGLARLNISNLIENNVSLKDESYQQAVTLVARTMCLLSNHTNVSEVAAELLSLAKENPQEFFIKKTFEIALPSIVPENPNTIAENYRREAEVLRSL